jgi:hypothetical protein
MKAKNDTEADYVRRISSLHSVFDKDQRVDFDTAKKGSLRWFPTAWSSLFDSYRFVQLKLNGARHFKNRVLI